MIARLALAHMRKVAGQVRGGSVRKPHEDTEGPPGGSLAGRISSGELLKRAPWGAVIQWARLGQEFTWLIRGTTRQVARPVDLAPAVVDVRRIVERDGLRHFKRRDRSSRAA